MCVLSIAVCTRNRVRYLSQCLDALVCQTVCSKKFQLIVIDNGSTDHTESLVQEFYSKFDNLIYHYEQKPGLSIARNKAIELSEGALIAYLDDDAIPSSNWVERILECWESHKPDCFGGKVTALWEMKKPDWITRDIEQIYSLIDYSDSGVRMNSPDHPWGVNIIFKKKVLAALGGFPEGLGRVGTLLLSGEESWVCDIIHKNNGLIWYDPSIAVQHIVPAERLSQRWARKRIFWSGVTAAVSESLRCHYSRRDCAIKGIKKFFNSIKKVKYILSCALAFFDANYMPLASKGFFKLGYVYGMLYVSVNKMKP